MLQDYIYYYYPTTRTTRMGFRGPLQMGSSPCIQYYRACGDLTEIQIWISSRSRYGLRTKPVYICSVRSSHSYLPYHHQHLKQSEGASGAARAVLLPSSRRGSRVCGTETGNSNTHQATPACALEFTGGALTTLSVDLTEYILLIGSSLDRAAGSIGRGGDFLPHLLSVFAYLGNLPTCLTLLLSLFISRTDV